MLYEDQAAGFDERAAIPAEVGESITDAVAEISGLAAGDTLLEIGAGTGMLSLPFLKRSIRYVGFDRSPAMLEIFRQKAEESGLSAELIVADGNERWPVDDRSTTVIFSARALHHIEIAHVVAETRRVLRAEGGWLMVGRVRRPKDSVKAVLRRQMRRILEAHGQSGRNHESYTGEVFTALEELGGEIAEPRVAARWTRMHAPIDSITAWKGKEGLAGYDIPEETKRAVLDELRAWAEAEYGDPTRPLEQEEFFELDAIHLRVG